MASTRPFIAYYGSKFRLARSGAYPPPLYGHIVEPFAGGAGYSLYWPDLEVTLVERDEELAAVWRWLIAANAKEIMKLPLLEPGQTREEVQWASEEASLFVGYWLSPGSAYSCNKLTTWAEYGKSSVWCERTRSALAAQIHLIDHWNFIEGDYTDAPRDRATWFIDPPYQGRPGSHYRHGSGQIDYEHLAHFCRDIEGQVIVCESSEADWLPFKPLCRQWGARGRSEEVICLLGDRAGQIGIFDDIQAWR